MKITYTPEGTCSKAIAIDINDGIIENVTFIGGCAGNTKGVSALIRGMKVEDAIKRLRGIECGTKGTSCPDQLARALEQAIRNN